MSSSGVQRGAWTQLLSTSRMHLMISQKGARLAVRVHHQREALGLQQRARLWRSRRRRRGRRRRRLLLLRGSFRRRIVLRSRGGCLRRVGGRWRRVAVLRGHALMQRRHDLAHALPGAVLRR